MSDAMKEQKPTPRPWRMLLPLLVVLALAAAWSVYWLVAASAARNTFDERMAFAAERGQRLDCASETWGGYPFRFEFTCDKPVVTDKALGVISSGRLRAVAMAYNPWHVLVLVDGPTIFTPNDRPPLTLNHHTILTSLQFADGASDPEVSVEIPDADLVGWFQAREVLLFTRPQPDGTTGVAISTSEANYQPTGRPPLPVATGSLVGSLGSDGLLKVDSIELQEGSVIYKGAGELGLDSQHRLSGLLATETNDFDGLMRILEPHLDMTPQQFAGFRTMAGLLARTSKVNITARDGLLYVGPVKVVDLVPLY